MRDGKLDVWMAGYGPKALALVGRKADGFILQLADPVILRWTVERVRAAAEEAGRDPVEIAICVAAPAYIGDDLAHAREQCRWFGGMVGNHVADLVRRYGEGGEIPTALTDYIRAREGYDYSHHGRAGNPDTEFVPDEIVDRFCVLGTVDEHIAKLRELRALGVDQFNIYLMHDAQEATLDGYGEHVIPRADGLGSAGCGREPPPAHVTDQLDHQRDGQRDAEAQRQALQRRVLERGAADVADERGVGAPGERGDAVEERERAQRVAHAPAVSVIAVRAPGM